MRKTAVLLSFLVVWSAFGQATPDSLLQRGTSAYRSGDFSSAVTDLQAAAQGFLSPDKMQTYVNTGKFEQLDKFETALVYLALAQSKLGREADARETILRLISAERISPTYSRLQISESGEFDALVTALVPSSTISRGSTQVAQSPTAVPPVSTAATPETRVATKRTIAEERAERQRTIEELVAKERERIQREADARIATERVAAAEAESQKRIAAAEAEAKERIAAAQRDADQRIAALEK